VVHRTVRWFTGLSGEPTVASANGRPRDQRATRGLCQRSVGHTRLSGAPIDPEDQRSDAPDMEGDRAPDCYSDCPVVHRAIRCTTRQKARLAFQVGLLKGKCALGPFLSILVIVCQHKCLNVNLCSWMDKVQIKSKGMFLSLSTLVLSTNILV
jgi:hypothetical protein